MHCNFLALWQKLTVYTWFRRKPIFFCWISIILRTLHMISMHCNFLALGQKLTVCTWFCRKPIYFRGISIILQTLQLSWNRCPLYALGDPTQLNDSLQAFGLLWKGVEDSPTYALGTIFLDLWKDSATLWHRDDFLPICNVYFQLDIVNPVKKYQLLVQLCT